MPCGRPPTRLGRFHPSYSTLSVVDLCGSTSKSPALPPSLPPPVCPTWASVADCSTSNCRQPKRLHRSTDAFSGASFPPGLLLHPSLLRLLSVMRRCLRPFPMDGINCSPASFRFLFNSAIEEMTRASGAGGRRRSRREKDRSESAGIRVFSHFLSPSSPSL
jgi:hypothetical protein